MIAVAPPSMIVCLLAAEASNSAESSVSRMPNGIDGCRPFDHDEAIMPRRIVIDRAARMAVGQCGVELRELAAVLSSSGGPNDHAAKRRARTASVTIEFFGEISFHLAVVI